MEGFLDKTGPRVSKIYANDNIFGNIITSQDEFTSLTFFILWKEMMVNCKLGRNQPHPQGHLRFQDGG